MKHVFDFFESFTERDITITELAKLFSANEDSFSVFFSEYDNYSHHQDFCHQFYVTSRAYNKDGEIVERAHPRFLHPDLVYKAHKIENRYYATEERHMDLFLAKHLFGIKPEMGSIDDSDIGGLSRSAWVYNDEREVPFYTREATDNILKQLPQNIWSITLEKGIFEVSTTYANISGKAQHQKLSLAIGAALKQFLFAYKGDKLVIQRSFDSNCSNPETISPVYYNYSEAENFKINLEQEDIDKELTYIITSI